MQQNRSYSPSFLAADDNVVYALIPELKELLEAKFDTEQRFVSVNYPHLWEYVHIENIDENVVLLHIDWPEQEDAVTIHFKQNQWKFLSELQSRNTLGIMYDFFEDTSETSGVFMLVELREGLDFVIDQLPQI